MLERNTRKMQQRTETLHQRVTPLIVRLIALEQKLNKGSAADALERLILRGSMSGEARELMYEETLKDPQLGPLVERLAERAEFQERGKGRKR